MSNFKTNAPLLKLDALALATACLNIAVHKKIIRKQEPSKPAIENMTEEEARAERKRRQRVAQEEFRQKQLQKQKAGNDENQEMNADGSTIDNLLMAMPTEDIIIEDSGHPEVERKRKSPAAENHPAKRRNSFLAKLNIAK